MPEFEESELYDLKDVEIFAAGKWKGEEYTQSDLDNMVHNFGLLGQKYKSPLKLGHDDNQKLAQADGYPAIGWIKELRRSGDKLLATFSSVPKKIKELIDKRAYGRFSSEVLWNFNYGGNVHKRVLKAVALLGADMPAVTSISDILALYTGDDIPNGEVHAYHDLPNERKEEEAMANEELQKQLDEATSQIAKLSAEAQTKDEALKALEAEKRERETAENKAKVYAAIDEGIKAGKIAPVQREYLAALSLVHFTGEEVAHKFADGEIKAKTSLDVLGEMIGKLPVSERFSAETSTTDDANKEKKLTQDEVVEHGGRKYSTDLDLDEKIKAIIGEKKISYSEAYQIAIQEVK